jgi:hypothetical protein
VVVILVKLILHHNKIGPRPIFSTEEIMRNIEIVSYSHNKIEEKFGNKFSRNIREKCLHLITVRYKRDCKATIESDSFIFYDGKGNSYRDGWPISRKAVKKHLLNGDLSLWGDWGRFANRFCRAEEIITPAEILNSVASDLDMSPREKVNLFRHRLTDYEKNTLWENRVICNLKIANLFPDLAEECQRQNSGRSEPSADGSADIILRKPPSEGARLYAFNCSRRQSGSIFTIGSAEQADKYCKLLNSVDKYTAASWWYQDLTNNQPADFPKVDELDAPLLSDLIDNW